MAIAAENDNGKMQKEVYQVHSPQLTCDSGSLYKILFSWPHLINLETFTDYMEKWGQFLSSRNFQLYCRLDNKQFSPDMADAQWKNKK
jgi:hypothetical protein